MSGSDWDSSMMTTWPCGRGGPGSSWPWRGTCSSTTSAAGRSWETGSMPKGCSTRTRRRFADKWGGDAPAGRPVVLSPWNPRREGDRTFKIQDSNEIRDTHGSRRARISLTMIVRDEETNLPSCLTSVRGVFDEVIVVDTGSVNRTREVAREYGAKVFEFAWIDDFAAARNAALQHATGDYAFWLDADDVIDPDRAGEARGPAGRPAAGRGDGPCRAMRLRPGADGSGGETVVDHIRLFPLRPDVRWTYRVHEQILPALKRAGIPVRWTGLVVRHTGYVDVALRARKLDRDARILQEELRDRPDEPFILFNLGAIAIERKDWQAALEFLGKSLAHSAPGDSITRKLFALIARAHQMRGDSEAALRVCAEGLSVDPQDAELLFRKAVIHRHRGESADAARCWRTILSLSASRTVRQRGHGDLRAPDPSQPGGAGRRAWGSWMKRRGTGGPCSPSARVTARRGRGYNRSRAPRSGQAGDDPAAIRAGADRPGNGESHARLAFERDRLSPHPMRSAAGTRSGLEEKTGSRGTSTKSVAAVSKKNRSHLHYRGRVLHCTMEKPSVWISLTIRSTETGEIRPEAIPSIDGLTDRSPQAIVEGMMIPIVSDDMETDIRAWLRSETTPPTLLRAIDHSIGH